MRQFFDEMHGTDGDICAAYAEIATWLAQTPLDALNAKREEAERLFRRIGITFAVYTEGGDTERLIPFDIIPRVLDADEWSFLERGLKQRVTALNLFLADVYGSREIVRAGKLTNEHIDSHPAYCAQMQGVATPGGVYTH
ncbi:MAG: circularly permuted type 2 ATP-grasp protein, partial [Terricaulis sp.]